MKLTRRGFVLAAIAAILPALPAGAASKAELRERFRERLRDVERLKRDGTVGETWDGRLEAVKDDLNARERKIVQDENSDRRALYEIIAEEENTTADLVAQRNAQRNLRNAQRGDWFKLKSGQWKQKE